MNTSTTDKHTKLCLIGGTGRSGTTIFKKIISNHPNAAGIREFRITVDPDGLVDFYRSMTSHWTPYLFDRKVRRLRKMLMDAANSNPLAKYYRYGLRKSHLSKSFIKLETRYTDIGIAQECPKYKSLVDQLIQKLTTFNYRGTWTGQSWGERSSISFSGYSNSEALASTLGNFYRDVVGNICQSQRATHFVDDNTWNILYFPHLLELIPEAKLVHIYRDPRDVTASYMKQSWAPSDAIQAAQFCDSILSRWHTIQSVLPEDSYREISLEDLVHETESTLREVLEFWELEWNKSMLALDLSKSNEGRWKEDIPDNQKDQVIEILKKHIKEYGYDFN